MEAIRDELFVEQGFRGNRDNYHHPDNSSMARVLATRKGLPILLSHVVVSVGERLEVPIVGLGVPGVYMAKYDGARAPSGYPKDDVIINAFEGRLMTVAQVREAHGALPPDALTPSPKKRTLVRMLTNLSHHYDAIGDPRLASQVIQYRAILEASDRNAADPNGP
jgi:regulator of sirC expression with transglutaminase-like and TPR domain